MCYIILTSKTEQGIIIYLVVNELIKHFNTEITALCVIQVTMENTSACSKYLLYSYTNYTEQEHVQTTK